MLYFHRPGLTAMHYTIASIDTVTRVVEEHQISLTEQELQSPNSQDGNLVEYKIWGAIQQRDTT